MGYSKLEDTELHAAIRRNDLDAVRKLIASGVALNEENFDGALPLYTAVDSLAEFGMIKMLVELGSPLDEGGIMPPLICAVWHQRWEVVKYFIGLGADVNVRAEDGSTSLHYAVSLKNQEIVELLIRAGTDPELMEFKDCMKPLHYTSGDFKDVYMRIVEQYARKN